MFIHIYKISSSTDTLQVICIIVVRKSLGYYRVALKSGKICYLNLRNAYSKTNYINSVNALWQFAGILLQQHPLENRLNT